jgi:hypothetical protein
MHKTLETWSGRVGSCSQPSTAWARRHRQHLEVSHHEVELERRQRLRIVFTSWAWPWSLRAVDARRVCDRTIRGRADPAASIAAVAAEHPRRGTVVGRAGLLGILTGFLIALSFYAWVIRRLDHRPCDTDAAVGGLPPPQPQAVQAQYDVLHRSFSPAHAGLSRAVRGSHCRDCCARHLGRDRSGTQAS